MPGSLIFKPRMFSKMLASFFNYVRLKNRVQGTKSDFVYLEEGEEIYLYTYKSAEYAIIDVKYSDKQNVMQLRVKLWMGGGGNLEKGGGTHVKKPCGEPRHWGWGGAGADLKPDDKQLLSNFVLSLLLLLRLPGQEMLGYCSPLHYLFSERLCAFPTRNLISGGVEHILAARVVKAQKLPSFAAAEERERARQR